MAYTNFFYAPRIPSARAQTEHSWWHTLPSLHPENYHTQASHPWSAWKNVLVRKTWLQANYWKLVTIHTKYSINKWGCDFPIKWGTRASMSERVCVCVFVVHNKFPNNSVGVARSEIHFHIWPKPFFSFLSTGIPWPASTTTNITRFGLPRKCKYFRSFISLMKQTFARLFGIIHDKKKTLPNDAQPWHTMVCLVSFGTPE